MLSTLEALATTLLVSVSIAALLNLEYLAIQLAGRIETRGQARIAHYTWSDSEITAASCATVITLNGLHLYTCHDSAGRSLSVLQD